MYNEEREKSGIRKTKQKEGHKGMRGRRAWKVGAQETDGKEIRKGKREKGKRKDRRKGGNKGERQKAKKCDTKKEENKRQE